jgi:hypothetical protein
MYWGADERGGWAGDGGLSADIGSRAVLRAPKRKKPNKERSPFRRSSSFVVGRRQWMKEQFCLSSFRQPSDVFTQSAVQEGLC